MKTIDMEIELMKHFGVRKNIIVPNVSWGMLPYEADLVVLTKSNYATEIEIKISKADLKKDKEKNHTHNSNYFKYLYFAVPEELKDFALTEIPEKAGLISVHNNTYHNFRYITCDVVRQPKLNKSHTQWSAADRYKLAELGTMRILGLKNKVSNLSKENRNQRMEIKELDFKIDVADSLIRKLEKGVGDD